MPRDWFAVDHLSAAPPGEYVVFMHRNAILSVLDVFLGRNMPETVLRQIRVSIARGRTAEPHPRRSRVGHQELEALMKQLARTPRRN